MSCPNGRHIVVSKKFAEILSSGHVRINRNLEKTIKKKMSFIDYTEFVGNMLSDDFDLMLTRSVITPIKKGRKSKNVGFDFNIKI